MSRAKDYAVEYPFYLPENKYGTYEDGNYGTDDMPTQIFDMVEKIHLALTVIPFVPEKVIPDAHNIY